MGNDKPLQGKSPCQSVTSVDDDEIFESRGISIIKNSYAIYSGVVAREVEDLIKRTFIIDVAKKLPKLTKNIAKRYIDAKGGFPWRKLANSIPATV